MTTLNSQSKRRRAYVSVARSRFVRRLAKSTAAQPAARKATAEGFHVSVPTAGSKTPATVAQVAGSKAEQRCSMDHPRVPTA